ncbi:MAG TPA: family 16 glycoside hydrolase [Chthoniobacter sp.]|jgi:azurin
MRCLPLTLVAFSLVAISTFLHAAEAPSTPEPKKENLTPGGIWKPGDISRPRPRVVTPPGYTTNDAPGHAPSDATILFDGKDLSHWKRDKVAAGQDDTAPWKVENGYFEVVPKSGYLRTRDKFPGDTQWHIEWATPSVVVGKSQGRGNSGVFLTGFPEIQVLDSFENDTYPDGQAAALYHQYPPLVNASRKPGEWQTYDIIVERAKRDAQGKVEKKARLTVIHNGLVVQWGREFNSTDQEGDLALQDHGNPVRYRNIWVRRLNLADPDSEGTPPPGAVASTAAPAVPATPKTSAPPAAEPKTVTIKTLRAQMRYDTTEFAVEAGRNVKLIFQNDDEMPHNLCFFAPGTDVIAAANKQMEKPEEALKRNWIPDDPRMWVHSKLVNPHERDEIDFVAPEKPGVYPYVCTFPGHAAIMQGKMIVGEGGPRLPALSGLKFQLYLGDWKNLPDFSALQPHREGEVKDNLVQLKLDDYKNDFGLVFTGKLDAPKDGDYTFLLASDDGGRILVDGHKVADDDGVHPATDVREGKVHLSKGAHDFRLEYFQAAGQSELYAAWRGPGYAITPLSKTLHPDWKNLLAKPKKHDETTGMPLVVGAEPVIYRNFITGGGDRGIAVGYPGNASIVWNAEYFGPVIAWRGAFIDAARHWNGRGGGFQLPLGFDVIRPAGENTLPFAIHPSPDAPWPAVPKGERADDYTWKGYELDAQRYPTFHYEWKGLKISERLSVDGDAFAGNGHLVRVLKIEGQIPEGAVLRLATGSQIQPADGAFHVTGDKLVLDGHPFDNAFQVAAEGAVISGKNLILPLRPDVTVSYSWPSAHNHHAAAQ